MLVKKIDHISINVKDLKKTFEFYENIMGLHRDEFIMDMGFGVVYYMGLPGSTRLELIDYRTENVSLTTKNTDLGIYRHIAFEVGSLDEIAERCRKYDAKVILNRSYNKFLKNYNMLVEDPNGVEIEFVEGSR